MRKDAKRKDAALPDGGIFCLYRSDPPSRRKGSMPDICRCANCDRETYAGQPRCPHCGAPLVAKAEPEPEVFVPDPPFEEMRAGLASGRLRVKLLRDGVTSQDIYSFIPKVYVREMLLRFVGLPAAALGGVVGLYALAPLVPEVGSDNWGKLVAVALFGPPVLLSFLLYRYRDARVEKRLQRDPQAYAAAMQHGLVEIVAAECRHGYREPR